MDFYSRNAKKMKWGLSLPFYFLKGDIMTIKKIDCNRCIKEDVWGVKNE